MTGTGATYRPLSVLKAVDKDIWIVDGPEIGFGPPGLKFPFPTRMTIVRLDGELFIHSPTELGAELKAEVEAIGTPSWIVGPSTLHYWWIPEWQEAFPSATVYLAAGIVKRSKGRIDMDAQPLVTDRGYPWDEQIATLPINSHAVAEVEFFHRRSRTLILVDLIENLEKERLPNKRLHFLAWLGGILHPNGSMPRDMRLTFIGRRRKLKRAVRQMIEWDPHRVILAHGRWFERDGRKELIRAFQWLLGSRSASSLDDPERPSRGSEHRTARAPNASQKGAFE